MFAENFIFMSKMKVVTFQARKFVNLDGNKESFGLLAECRAKGKGHIEKLRIAQLSLGIATCSCEGRRS